MKKKKKRWKTPQDSKKQKGRKKESADDALALLHSAAPLHIWLLMKEVLGCTHSFFSLCYVWIPNPHKPMHENKGAHTLACSHAHTRSLSPRVNGLTWFHTRFPAGSIMLQVSIIKADSASCSFAWSYKYTLNTKCGPINEKGGRRRLWYPSELEGAVGKTGKRAAHHIAGWSPVVWMINNPDWVCVHVLPYGKWTSGWPSNHKNIAAILWGSKIKWKIDFRLNVFDVIDLICSELWFHSLHKNKWNVIFCTRVAYLMMTGVCHSLTWCPNLTDD